MLFANPLLLAGTALVALPIVLHLIMRRRPRHFEFPAVRFVQRRHEKNRRQLRVQHWLLLALRAAAIALLALALARPSMKLSAGLLGSQEAPVAAALVFDTAPRMDYRQENRTRLDVAREMGLKLLAQLPPESQIAVLDTRLGPAVFQADRGSAKQQIERLETAADSQPLVRAIDEALKLVTSPKLVRKELVRKEVYVFTDLTQAAWPPGATAGLQDRLADARAAAIYLIDVGVEKPVNFALGQVRLSSQVLSQRTTLQIDTDVGSVGQPGQRTVELFVLDRQRKPQNRGAQSVTLTPGESQHVEFRVGALEVGTHQGFVRVAGQDGLAADDTRYFTVEVQPAWRVLILAPPVAERYAVYLSQALAPTSFRKQGQARFDCDVRALEQLNTLSLAPYAAVCLLDPKPLTPGAWRKLVNHASEGHGVAVFLGRNARAIDSFNDAPAQELLPGKLTRQARDPQGLLHLAPRDYEHPALAEFRAWATTVPWSEFPVFRYWALGPLAPGVNVIAPFSDNRPAILERPLGQGKAITMTTPVSDRPNQDPWNLLPVDEPWPFVILAQQMLTYLVGAAEQQLNYYAGQTAVLALDRQSPRTPYVITTPLDETFLQAPDPEKNALAVTATERSGNYRVQAGGEKAGVDRGFSVNLGPEQTALERLPADKLQEIFGPFEFRLARSAEQLDRAVSTARVGRELFPALILALALVLAFEHVVANRFYKD